MAYSLDLRQRIVEAVKEGSSQPEVAERFKVSLTSVERYMRLHRQGNLQAKSPPGRPASIKPQVYQALAEQVAKHVDATLAEHCQLWEQVQGTKVSIYSMCRAMKRAKLRRKKDLKRQRARS